MKRHRQRWARLPTLAGTMLASLIAGSACDAATPTPSPSTPAAVPTTSSPTPNPSVALAGLVTTAGVTPKDLGVTKPPTEESVGKFAMPCDTPLVARSVAAHTWTFSGAKPAVVSNSVFAYYPEAGAAVVAQIRPALTACKTWTWAGTWEMTVVGELTVTRPDGTDNAVAYCHHGTVLTGTNKGDQVYLCDGVVSRGHLMSQVSTVQVTLAAAQGELVKALPLAGAALVRAVAAA